MNNKLWSAYSSNTKPGGPKLPETTELEELLARHPNASHFYKEGEKGYNIRLVTCSVDSPDNPIDVRGSNEDGTPVWPTDALISLLANHKTEQGILMRADQATAVYNVLHVPTEERMV